MKDKIYIYTWGNNAKRQTMKNRKCKILARGRKNSIIIKFLDNNTKQLF